MSRITLDATTADLFRQAALGAELYGPDGQPVGDLVPVNLRGLWRRALDERRRAITQANAAVSVEDLEAADAGGGEIPHEEVLERLGLE